MKAYIRRDYVLDSIKDDSFDYFIDIGGGRGDFVSAILEISPSTKVFVYEPFVDGYNYIAENFRSSPNVFVFNEAFGNGSVLYLHQMPRWDQNMFIEGNGSQETKSVISRTLQYIIDFNNIDLSKRCGLKMDCEGGEWCLLDENIELLRKFTHIMIEVHFKPRGNRNPQFSKLPPWEKFNSWIEKYFRPFFDIKYGSSSRLHGHGIYTLKRINGE